MKPGAKTHGMEADLPRYPWSKYKCFLRSSSGDIPHLRNLNITLWKTLTVNSTNVMQACTNKHTNGWTERWKLYTPRHKCRGFKNWKCMNIVSWIQTASRSALCDQICIVWSKCKILFLYYELSNIANGQTCKLFIISEIVWSNSLDNTQHRATNILGEGCVLPKTSSHLMLQK